LRFYGRVPYDVIDLELSSESAEDRLSLRGRNDDKAEKAKKRIKWYMEEVRPLISKFASFDGIVHKIDGEPSVEEIHKNIIKALKLS